MPSLIQPLPEQHGQILSSLPCAASSPIKMVSCCEELRRYFWMSRGSVGKPTAHQVKIPALKKRTMMPAPLRVEAQTPTVWCMAVAKLDFGLQTSRVLARVTGMFKQARSPVVPAAWCPLLQGTEDSAGPSGSHFAPGCMKRCPSPELCKRTLPHPKQACKLLDRIEQLGFTEPS